MRVCAERAVWQATKAVYSSLIAQSIRLEIAESFFNSLTRRVFATEGVDQAIEFVDTDFDVPPTEHDGELCRRYHGAPLPELLADALTDADGAALRESAGAISTAQWPTAAERISAATAPPRLPRWKFSKALSIAAGALIWLVA